MASGQEGGKEQPHRKKGALKPSPLLRHGMGCGPRAERAGPGQEHPGPGAPGDSEMKRRLVSLGSGGRHEGARKAWPGAKAQLLGEMCFVAPASSAALVSPHLWV